MSKITNTCDVTMNKEGKSYTALFSPGLPYDRDTKGCPHTEVTVSLVTIQKSESKTHKGVTHFLFSNKERTYIYAMRPTDGFPTTSDLKKVIAEMGYTVIDSDEALAKVARSKLTDAEYRVLTGKTKPKARKLCL